MTSDTKPGALHFRVTQQFRQAIDKAALDDGRTVSQYASRVLEEHLREKGYLPPNEKGPTAGRRGASKDSGKTTR